MRAAIIGCGLIGTRRARAFAARGVDVAAVYDIDGPRAQRLAAEFPGALAADTPADAYDHGVDVAVVATVHAALAPLAVEALAAGCHVLIEKPGAHRIDALEEVHLAAEKAGRAVRVGFNHRFHPAILKAKELVASGRYGRILGIRGRYGHGGRAGYEKEWRADPELSGGGELLDQGIHLIDLTRHLAGDVTLAFAELRSDFWPIPVEDNAYLALRLRHGGFAWLHASWTEWKNLFSFEIALETAKLEISGLGGSYGVERLTLYEMLPEMGPPLTFAWEWPMGDNSWELEADDVMAAIAGHDARGAGLDDCRAAFQIIDEAYRQ